MKIITTTKGDFKMTHVRFNHRNCMPAQTANPASQNLVNWFWNDFTNGFNDRSVPSANIVETKEDFRIELTVPGFLKNDFRIKLEDHVLHISGEAEELNNTGEERYIRHEFSRSAFSRRFRLSNQVDSVNIVAKYENGILMVTIPKVEEAKTKPAKDIEIA